MIYAFEGYSLDSDLRELRRGTDLVAVEPQVFDLLHYLIRNRERVVSKDDMIAAVWKGRIVSESALTSRLTAVRHAVGDSGEEQRLIRTMPRKGLRFVAEVREEQPSAAARHAARPTLSDRPSIAVLPFTNMSGDPEQPMGEQHMKNVAEPVRAFRVKIDGTPPRRMMPRTAKRLWPWATAATALMMVAIWFATAKPSNTPGPSTIPSIAVLPFDDMSPEHNLGYLGDGVADDIISMLARSPDLAVVARNSSFVYKGKATDVRQIGKELGVGFVLEGSVRKDRDKVRITAQLIDTRNGEGVWAEHFDKTGVDPWALQDDVTGRIIGALGGESGQLIKSQYRQAWGKDSANLQEYDYYLRGNDIFTNAIFTNAQSAEDWERAGAIWREGLAQFPNSPLLKVKLGLYHFNRVVSFISEDYDADANRAASLAHEALAAPDISPLVRKLAHWLLARVLSAQHQPKFAIAEAESAAALAPFDANMLGNLAATLIENGQVEEGLEWIERASSREPGAEKVYNYRRGWAYTVLGRSEEAIAKLSQGPDDWVDVPILMAINYVRLGRLDEAKAEIARARWLEPGFTQLSWRKGYFYSDPSILDGQIADLNKAGLPEK